MAAGLVVSKKSLRLWAVVAVARRSFARGVAMSGRWFPVICGVVLACAVGTESLRGEGPPTASKPMTRKEFQPAPPGWVGLAPGEAERRAAIEEKLDQVTDVAMDDVSVGDAIRKVLGSIEVVVRFDETELESSGSGHLADPVSLTLSGVSARTALDLLLRPRDWVLLVRDNHCVVTTRSWESVGNADETAIYDVTDLGSNPDGQVNLSRLMTLIQQSIEPGRWGSAGGTQSIQPLITAKAALLVVRASGDSHRGINSLLSQMREAGAGIVPAEMLVDRTPVDTPAAGMGGAPVIQGGFGGGGGGGFF